MAQDGEITGERRLCQRTITISKIIVTQGGKAEVLYAIDGMMDFSLYELGEVMQLVTKTISDIKDNFYG